MSLSKFTFLYFLIGAADLIVLSLYPSLRWITKPLIMLSLIAFFYTQSKESSPTRWTFYTALFFALLGDIFLLKDGSSYFLCGLGSFLVMQLLYSLVFIRDGLELKPIKIPIALAYVAILIYFLSVISGDLESMTIPVFVYSSIIVMMSLCALFRKSGLPGYFMIAVGSILFMISDGFIAWNSFVKPVQYGGIIVMSTYIIAQYLIVVGWMRKKI